MDTLVHNITYSVCFLGEHVEILCNFPIFFRNFVACHLDMSHLYVLPLKPLVGVVDTDTTSKRRLSQRESAQAKLK